MIEIMIQIMTSAALHYFNYKEHLTAPFRVRFDGQRGLEQDIRSF